MNGSLTSLLIWVATGLVGLVSVLASFAINQHIASDKEYRDKIFKDIDDLKEDITKEIDKLRDRVHTLDGKNAEAITRLRWINDDMERRWPKKGDEK